MAIPQAQPRYLQVQTPRTTDGINLAYDKNNQIIYRTSFLPITALTELKRNTSKLPKHLQPKIEIMEGSMPEEKPAASVAQPAPRAARRQRNRTRPANRTKTETQNP